MAFNNSTEMLTNNEHSYMDIWQNMSYYKYGIFIFVIILSLLGNMTISITIISTKKLQRMTNYFLLNMAVADALVTMFCMPAHLLSWENPSIMTSQLSCKALPFIQGVCLCCVINTLIVIAIDRFMVIIYPFGFRFRKCHCFITICGIWVVSMVTSAPCLFVYEVKFDDTYEMYRCDEFGWSENDRVIYTYVLTVLIFFIPLLVLIGLYGKIFYFLWFRKIPGIENLPETCKRRMIKKCMRRKKIIRMLLVVVTTFMLCQLPQTVLNFLWYFQHHFDWTPPDYMPIIGFHAELILYANTALNPLVYGLFHQKIKQTIHDILCNRKKRNSQKIHKTKRTTKMIQLKPLYTTEYKFSSLGSAEEDQV